MVFKANPVKTLGHIGHTGHIYMHISHLIYDVFFPGKVPKISEKPEPRALGIWSAKQSSKPGAWWRVSPPRKTATLKRDFLKTLGIPFFRAWLFLGGVALGAFPGKRTSGSWKRPQTEKESSIDPKHRVFGFQMVPAVRFSGVFFFKTSLTSYITSILSMKKSYLFHMFWHTKKTQNQWPTFNIRKPNTKKMVPMPRHS